MITASRETLIAKAALMAVLSLLVMPLLYAGQAGAFYPPNGAKPDGAGGYMNPNDGMCVIGVAADGTMLVDWSITNARDCVAWTKSADATVDLAGMTAVDVTGTLSCGTAGTAACNSSTLCTRPNGSVVWHPLQSKCLDVSACVFAGSAPNDGYKHAWSTNLCYDVANSKGISRIDLDNTAAMCASKGGTVVTTGKCVAYGWVYRNRKANTTCAGGTNAGAPCTATSECPGSTCNNPLPITGSGISTTDGVQTTDDLGFCYTTMRMTDVPYTGLTCPSLHNLAKYCSAGDAAKLGTSCTSNSGCGTGGVCTTNPEWPACGSSTTGCQTQASYDAGLGWSWDSTNSRCLNSFSVEGFLNAALVSAAGTTPNVTMCDGTTAAAAAGTCVDLTGVANQGDCLAIGGSWDNWLPKTGTKHVCQFLPFLSWGNSTCASAADCSGGAACIQGQLAEATNMCSGGTNNLKECTSAANCTGGSCIPQVSLRWKLDALTPVESGGGEFFSGTGFNCLRCHSDMSRAYMERYKPGFVKTRHQKAGDDLSKPFAGYFTGGSSDWGLQGVQCAMCHSTAKPARDDLIQVVPAGVVGPPAAGAPKSATGHNQTEYGAHLLDICYTCHGSAANPPATNPASVIPVSAGDWALTSNLPGPPTSNLGNANCISTGVPTACCTGLGTGTCAPPPNTAGLAPIANQFLNSPHAQYVGSSTKVDIGNKTNYLSSFEGYVCRTAATTVSGSLAPGGTWNIGNCGPVGGHSWVTPAGATAAGCYYNSTSCAAAGNTWNTVFDPNQYPVNNGGVCSGISLGSIITTVYRSGAAEKIPNLDSTTNAACANPGDGSATSGAGGYWVKDGETSPLGTPADTAQGNCMTCHDVHWALADTDPEAEPFRRECPTCHVDPGVGNSASSAPQIDPAKINHLVRPGTPLENMASDLAEACEICHMPKSGGDSSSPMHLWRISTDPTYVTMGPSQAYTAPDKACSGGANDGHVCTTNDPNLDCPGGTCSITYTGAAWVDLDHACGQCHGGSGAAKPGVPYLSTAQLAPIAKGMHKGASVSYGVTFSTAIGSPNTLSVTATAAVNCGGPCPPLTYDWNWNDGSAHDSGDPGIHAYASEGPVPHLQSITLTVKSVATGLTVGAVTRSVTLANPDLSPTAGRACTLTPNSWTAQLVDSSTDDGADADMTAGDGTASLTVIVDWGDGSTKSIGAAGATYNHAYVKTTGGPFTITQKVIDSKLQAVSGTCSSTITIAPFTIGGTVENSSHVAVYSATVTVKDPVTLVSRTVYTDSLGHFTASNLKPGTYTVTAKKSGYVFPAGVAQPAVGPSISGVTITAISP